MLRPGPQWDPSTPPTKQRTLVHVRGESDPSAWQTVLALLWESHFGSFLFAVVLRTVAHALLFAALGVAIFLVLRALGVWGAVVRQRGGSSAALPSHAVAGEPPRMGEAGVASSTGRAVPRDHAAVGGRAARVLIGVAFGLAFLAGGAYDGFWRGVELGAETMVAEGPLGRRVLPVVGDAVSVMLVAAAYEVPQLDDPHDVDGGKPPTDLVEGRPEGEASRDAKVGASRVTARWTAGELSLDPLELADRLEHSGERGAKIASERARAYLEESSPELMEGATGQLISYVLEGVAVGLGARAGDYALSTVLDEGTGAIVSRTFDAMIRGLPTAAAERDDTALLDHQELSRHVVVSAVIPSLLLPLKIYVAWQRNFVWVCLAVLTVVAAIVGLVVQRTLARRAARRDTLAASAPAA